MTCKDCIHFFAVFFGTGICQRFLANTTTDNSCPNGVSRHDLAKEVAEKAKSSPTVRTKQPKPTVRPTVRKEPTAAKKSSLQSKPVNKPIETQPKQPRKPRQLKQGRDEHGRDYEQRRQWREANKDKLNAQYREWYAANKDKPYFKNRKKRSAKS